MAYRTWRFLAAAAIVIVPAWIGCAAGVTSETDVIDGEGGGGQGGAAVTSSSSGAGGSGGSPVGGACVTVADCGNLNSPCTVGACVNGVCQKIPSNEFGACDDGKYCTEDDICQDGACVAGTTKFCPSLDSCHLGVCDEDLKTCKNIAGNDGAQCEDNDACTNAGVCMSGACAKGAPVDCTVFDGECSIGVCDPVVGCKPISKNDGVACNDGKGSPCSVGVCSQGFCTSKPMNEGILCEDFDGNYCTGQCINGNCASVAVNDGSLCEDFDGNICTGQCIGGVCAQIAVNDGAACEDGQFCTIGDKCVNGVCAMGQPNPCAPPGGCWIATCDENADVCSAVPGNNGQPCDDGSLCTSGTTCSNGICAGGAPMNNGMACDDGTACTMGETCNNGQCNGGVGVTVFFAEDFSDNNAGWTLGPEWQIGFATASNGGVFGADPAVDHSPTPDNGVAGVVIGGNENPNLHPYYYLESPPFNTAGAAGQVVLGFYRWLNSDYDPYMHNTVEVYNGNSWVTLWTSGGPPGVEDSPPNGMGWTFIQHDVTAYKSASMRVRFGFDVTSGGVYTIGSWNIDDVLVADKACP